MRRRAVRARDASGATLIELVVAILILSIGLLPLLLSLNRIYMDTYALSTRDEAQHLAADKVDELKSQGYLHVSANVLAGSESVTVTETSVAGSKFTRVTLVAYQMRDTSSFRNALSSEAPTDFIKLTSTVGWSIEGDSIERSLTAMLTKEGSLE